MDQSTKDIIDVVAKSITALSFLLAATGLYFNWRVRKEDLRWRMATAARDAFTDLHKNAFAVEAAEMIDCVRWDEQYNAPTALSDLVGMRRETILCALSPHEASAASASLSDLHRAYVRHCFDWLLYYMDRVAYQTNVGFLQHDDFDAPLAPYAKFIHDHWDYFGPLAEKQNYLSLPSQIERLAKASPEN